MVTLPKEFTSAYYPGYYWNVAERVLYSLKVDGILKPLKKVHPSYFNQITESGYRVSVKGRYRFIPMSKLMKLSIEDSEVGVKK